MAGHAGLPFLCLRQYVPSLSLLQNGWTALRWAAQMNHRPVVKALLGDPHVIPGKRDEVSGAQRGDLGAVDGGKGSRGVHAFLSRC